MTAPDPIVVFDFEHNLPETMRSFPAKEGSIVRYGYMVPVLGDKAAAESIANAFLKDFDSVMNKLNVGKLKATIVFDSSTQMWELLRFAFAPVDDKGRANARDYGPAANKLASLYQKAKSNGHRIIATARAKDEWSNNAPTGNVIPDYYKGVAYSSSIIIEVASVAGTRTYQIRRCKVNEALEALPPLSDLTYESLMKMVDGA